MKKFFLPALVVAALIAAMLPGCKPTEKNYKTAYDLAQRRDRDDLDEEIYNKIKEEGRPRALIVGADTLLMIPKEPLTLYWDPSLADTPQEKGAAPRFSLVVGVYRNPANALAHIRQFVGNDSAWLPILLRNPVDDAYYVAVSHAKTAEQLIPAQRVFKHRKLRVVGLESPQVRSPR